MRYAPRSRGSLQWIAWTLDRDFRSTIPGSIYTAGQVNSNVKSLKIKAGKNGEACQKSYDGL
jgi:hypothetical protein